MCGIVGIITPKQHVASIQSSSEVYRALLSLQHRGQDAAGILSYNTHNKQFHWHKDQGLISQVFHHKHKLEKLTGEISLGHTRYTTVGPDSKVNLQPMLTGYPFGVGMIHNGNILNYHSEKKKLEQEDDQHFLSNNDLELLLNYWCKIFQMQPIELSFFEKAQNVTENIFENFLGAFSVIGVMASKGMFAFRDPNGIRPLVLGRKNNDNNAVSYCLTSETDSLNIIGYDYVRDIEPGELIYIDLEGNITNKILRNNAHSSPCMFEWVYFSGARSVIQGKSVYDTRFKLGTNLANKIKTMIEKKELFPDVVVPVPDTSRISALAIAEVLKLPYREGLLKNRYSHRSFILNSQIEREKMVELKLSPVPSEVKGKKILLVDDSVVRGTTSKKIVDMLKRYGAKEVYMAVACPPIKNPCYYGIDFPSSKELLAAHKTYDEISKTINIEKIIYLDLEDLKKSIGLEHICSACLDGNYPTDIGQAKIFSEQRIIEQKEDRWKD